VIECSLSLKILAQSKTTNITFVKEKGTEENAILVEEKATKQGLDNKIVLQHD
jgi:hypothetical protein